METYRHNQMGCLFHMHCPLQVPYRLLKAFQKVHPRLVRELEKKFSGKDVVLVANRRIQPKPSTGMAKARPRSRTLTSVRAWCAACAMHCPCI